MGEKYLCIHGHFYQPPRENPWLGHIEAQPSALPYHDWNERINRECYAPNAHARVLDGAGRVFRIINNYEYLSFNFGPTLLSWMEKASPEAYSRILEADRKSRDRNDGHGNAIAQVYNHIIMPLANKRDQLTQIRWGKADFRHRFGREPEGMWLAETAVNRATLKYLAQEGIKFTILAPEQAKMIRPRGASDDTWEDVRGGRVDPRRPYRVFLDKRGRDYIDVFFFDSPVSRAIAYEKLLVSGAFFQKRIESAFGGDTEWPRLVNLATDGESYGHHSKFGEMALGWVFDNLEKQSEISIINYGCFLDRFPPEYEVVINDNTSWSCSHGVDRWQADCGCRVGGKPDWNQQWRKPLRKGLNRVRNRLIKVYETNARDFFDDPWAVRDAYIDVLLNQSKETKNGFLVQYGKLELNRMKKEHALCLLESQANAMFMFTSCGWFFDDIAGLEPVQNMKYARRAMDLVKHWDSDIETDFVNYLSEARVNDSDYRDGADVYRREALSSRISASRITAHYAMTRLVGDDGDIMCPLAGAADSGEEKSLEVGGLKILYGEVSVADHSTCGMDMRTFIVFHQVGADMVCLVIPDRMSPMIANDLEEGALGGSSIRAWEVFFKYLKWGERFELVDLIPETRKKLIKKIAKNFFDDIEEYTLKKYQERKALLTLIHETGEPQNHIEKFIFLTVVRDRLNDLLSIAESESVNVESLSRLALQAKNWGVPFDEPALNRMAQDYLKVRFKNIKEHPDEAVMREVLRILNLTRNLGLNVDLWESVNEYYDLMLDDAFIKKMTPEQKSAFDELGVEMNFVVN